MDLTLLKSLTHPSQVAKLSFAQKETLAQELRQIIIQTVAANGGHLAPSLGVIELTIALLSVFNPEQDKLIWDVGHQAYAWKLLTGRLAEFSSLRKLHGLSGFPNIFESKFDHFGVGHSSTSISAALGMALARDLSQQNNHVLAIIGDGALTAGMAFEGLNQAGAMGKKLIVILNDNEMSISRNVGALSLFLTRNMERGWARRVRKEVKDWLKSIPGIGDEMAEYAHRTHRSLKTVFTPGMLFEALRFNYIGPVNGHNLPELEQHLSMAAALDNGPILLHVLTKKGKGYAPAEADPSKFHGLGTFNAETGETTTVSATTVSSTSSSSTSSSPTSSSSISSSPTSSNPLNSQSVVAPTYTQVFGETLCQLAETDERIVTITAAMASGTGTAKFKSKFPQRFVDVGICEQHALTFAAGLAKTGLRPFVAIYSTFAQRAYDQLIHDIALQKLPVTICLDRAGLVGEDGPTHHGSFDLSFTRHIPNLHILAPSNELELQAGLLTSLQHNFPLVIRYPRGQALGITLPETIIPLPIDQGKMILKGSLQNSPILVIACGSMVEPARLAVQNLASQQPNISLYDLRWIKPLPTELLELSANYSKLLLIEENALMGGVSSAILELLSDNNALQNKEIKRLGLPDAFVPHGTQAQLRQQLGLDSEGITKILQNWL